MIYDESISKTVSLSKILDAFIKTDESPSIILNFLKLHSSDKEIKQIFEYSFYWTRIFQLDFFIRCDDSERRYVIYLMNNIPKLFQAMFIWQILMSKDKSLLSISNGLRAMVSIMLEEGEIGKHPYSGRNQRYIQDFDNALFELSSENNIVRLAQSRPSEKVSGFFKNIFHSLFKFRIYQYDFFSELDYSAKKVFLGNIFNIFGIRYNESDSISFINFFLQILDEEQDAEIKKIAFENYKCHIHECMLIPDRFQKFISECSTFDEFLLKKAIFQDEMPVLLPIYFLFFKYDWLKKWIEFGKEEVDSFVNVSSLVQAIDYYNSNYVFAA